MSRKWHNAGMFVVLVGLFVAGIALTVSPANLGPGGLGALGTGTPHRVCARPVALLVTCSADVLVRGLTAGGVPELSSATPGGLSPAQIQSDYGFPPTAGAGQTVAVVDAYDDPTVQNDLQTFSTQFGLPACTTANGCFSKLNENGSATLPAVSTDGLSRSASTSNGSMPWPRGRRSSWWRPPPRASPTSSWPRTMPADTPPTSPTAGALWSSTARRPSTATSPSLE